MKTLLQPSIHNQILGICIFVALSANCFAQSGFKKGQVDFNAGIGFITPLFNNDGEHVYQTTINPVSGTLDFGVGDDVSFGLYAGYTQADVYGDIYERSGNTYYGKQGFVEHKIFGGRLLYHFGNGRRLDLYSGAMLAYNDVTETPEPGIEIVGITKEKAYTYSVLLGARWRFAKVAGFFVEAGYGVTIINTGINIKF